MSTKDIDVVGIYLRVSTREQDTELQEREIIKFLDQKGWCHYAIYEDHCSGTTDKRPELARLLYDAEHGSIHKIVVWKLDRLFRSLKDLVNTLHRFSEWNVDFVSIKDQIDLTTASGRLMTHLLAAFAEFEAALIRERVRAGLENAKAKGKVLGRPRQINPVTVLELRSQGMSLSEISRFMGVSKSTVSKTLKKFGEKKTLKNPDFTQAQKTKQNEE